MTSILSPQKWVFNVTNSNDIILANKNIFSIFWPFLKSASNFEQFEKKNEPHRWCISEIVDCKKRGYLNA